MKNVSFALKINECKNYELCFSFFGQVYLTYFLKVLSMSLKKNLLRRFVSSISLKVRLKREVAHTWRRSRQKRFWRAEELIFTHTTPRWRERKNHFNLHKTSSMEMFSKNSQSHRMSVFSANKLLVLEQWIAIFVYRTPFFCNYYFIEECVFVELDKVLTSLAKTNWNPAGI